MEENNNEILKINLWDSKLAKNYIFFNDFESYYNHIMSNNLDFSFELKESFIPSNDPKNILDEIAVRDNVEITYTDETHPIAIPKDGYDMVYPHFINPLFYKQNKDKFIKYAREKLLSDIKNKKYAINIPDFALTDELLNEILNNPDLEDNHFRYQMIDGIELTEEQIKSIKEKHLYFIIREKEIKEISSNIAIDYYTFKQLKNIERINIYFPNDFDIENFKYINENATINFLISFSEKEDEEYYFNEIKRIFEVLSSHDHKYNIIIDVDNRYLLKQSKLLDSLPKNINLMIKNDLHNYDLESYLIEEEKLEKIVAPIRDSNLSPLEKYLAVYNIVKQFKPYKEKEKSSKESRYLRYILDNDYIVCVGFAKLLEELLNRVGIPNKEISVGVDTSYDKGFTQEEINVYHEGHARNLIKLDDDKYNIHGYYLADATWDNDIENDLYLNCLMTFDRKKEAKRLENLSDEDLLLDFHNFDEFLEKLNYFLKKEMNNPFNINKDDQLEEKIIKAYKYIYRKIMEILKKTNFTLYKEFFNKYDGVFSQYNITLKELEPFCNEMLTEYAKYIIPLSNNKIEISTIIKASSVVKKEFDLFSDEELKEWLTETIDFNRKKELKSFPYKYNPNNPTEAFLEMKTTEEISESIKKQR